MRRKDFELIAQVIHKTNLTLEDQIALAHKFVQVLRLNENFDADKFRQDCGL